MNAAWPATRIAYALLGVLTLAAGLVLAYFSVRSFGEPGPAPGSASVLRMHGAPRALADVTFEDGQGGKRALEQFRGKLVLLNVWAAWCAPCREEMPALDRLQQHLGGPGFEVLALSIDGGGAAAVRRFYDEMGIRSLAVYVDSSMRATGALDAVGIPTTLLIDAEGREIGRRTGPAQWDGPDAVRVIETYLNGKSGS